MLHFKISDLFRCNLLIAGFFLVATSILSGQDLYLPEETQRLFKTTVTTPDPHNIILDQKNSTGRYPISVFRQTQAQDMPNDSMRFFVILPDGNFIYLDAASITVSPTDPLVSTITPFKTEIRLQNIGNTASLKIEDMKVTALKKNNPDPPLRPGPQTQPTYRGGGNDIPTTGSGGLASNYLDDNTSIKIGTSWAPWDSAGAYYYLIISYSNKTSGNVDTGTIKLRNCIGKDPTGFNILDYTAYNTLGDNLWETDKTPPPGLEFGFKDLKYNEIRHIYIRMNRDAKPKSLMAYYKAEINYPIDSNIFSEETPCKEILMKTAPHDPNTKLVDQSACTANGTGTLSYYITFQNEGNGVAKDVILIDTLPQELAPYVVRTMDSSYPVTLDSTFGNNRIAYTFTDIMLPGTAQTVPRIYDYNETVGWVRFSCAATCPGLGKNIENNASIVFVTLDNVHLAPIHTENAKTTPDNIKRDGLWPVINSCPSKCFLCIRNKRCRWCLWCVYRYPGKKSGRHTHNTKHH